MTFAVALLATLGLAVGAAPAVADGPRPTTYQLTGDVDSTTGSKFEGIGADERRGLFYVSEVTGGEIHRGSAHSDETVEWLDGDGTDGRFTARGITVDEQGRVDIAGGPNGIGTGRPDLWVYEADGTLLAALRAPGVGVFLNDVALGPDGAACFTNSNDAQVFRVADDGAGWQASLWADATDRVERLAGFNLDGLVLRGNQLTVVRNFSRMIATLRLSADGSRAVLLDQEATAADRVLTTAKGLRGRILYLDSKFDEPVATGPYEILTDPTR
ncbi:gluconolaconase [Tessaracoccus sp. MC1679]|nr:gluconolaconase [Tessaracoccus sp. MC1679]